MSRLQLPEGLGTGSGAVGQHHHAGAPAGSWACWGRLPAPPSPSPWPRGGYAADGTVFACWAWPQAIALHSWLQGLPPAPASVPAAHMDLQIHSRQRPDVRGGPAERAEGGPGGGAGGAAAAHRRARGAAAFCHCRIARRHAASGCSYRGERREHGAGRGARCCGSAPCKCGILVCRCRDEQPCRLILSLLLPLLSPPQFPRLFEPECVRLVHHSLEALEPLCQAIAAHFATRFVQVRQAPRAGRG